MKYVDKLSIKQINDFLNFFKHNENKINDIVFCDNELIVKFLENDIMIKISIEDYYIKKLEII